MIPATNAFPAHLAILLEAGMLLAWLALAGYRPRLGERLDRWLHRWLRRWARRPRRTLLILALATAAGNAAVVWQAGFPEPDVADEFSYLLAADTFAHGRLANPQHPMWQHFESLHVIQDPTHSSKYPPAQGLLLALGQRFGGHPGVGLWLGSALLVAAAGWMLLGWLPPPWAIYGSLWVALHLGIGSYWNQTYWGGSLAAIGGALLFGALPRLLKRPHPRDAVLLALGVALLANTRPWEGLVVCLEVAVVLALWLLRRPHRALSRFLLPASAVLLATAACMLIYNQRGSGEALRMPYQVHEATYAVRPLFLWQDFRPEPQYRHPEMRDYHLGYARRVPQTPSWPWRALVSGWDRIATQLYFVLGLGLIPALLALPLAWHRQRARLLVGCGALLALASAVSHAWWPHYSAPLAVPLLALGLICLRYARVWRRHQARGRWLPIAALSLCVASLVVQLPFLRPAAEERSQRRARIEEQLHAHGGKHLVFVRYAAVGAEWVYNAADIDRAEIVWARQMGARDQELIDYYPGRQAWSLDLDPRTRQRSLKRLPAAN